MQSSVAEIPRIEKCNIVELGRGKWAVYTPGFRSETCITDSFEKAKYILEMVNKDTNRP